MTKVGHGLLAWLFGSMLFSPICSRADPVVERGFSRALEGHSLAERVAAVNLLVGDTAQTLVPAWGEQSGEAAERVAVYLVEDRLGTVAAAQVGETDRTLRKLRPAPMARSRQPLL